MSKDYLSNDHTGRTFLSANTRAWDYSKYDGMLNDLEAAARDALKAADGV
jgi:hypothetical protein